LGVYVLELGGEDDRFAAAEAAAVATDVSVLAPGLATASAVSDGVRGLAFTHRVSEVVGRPAPDAESTRSLVESAAFDREGSVAVRARDVRGRSEVDTQAIERTLGRALVDRGFSVDLDHPDHELRVLCAPDAWVVGWLTAESVRDFGDRRPTDRPFFQPGSMDPLLARGLANLVGSAPGKTILDPMCGTGGGLAEAGLLGANVVGIDAQLKMAAGAARNLGHYLSPAQSASGLPSPGDWHTARGDATALPLPDDAVDGVVFDAPYGRQSKIANRPLDDLVRGALTEARRVAPRAVVVGDRSWADAAADAGWTVSAAFERRVHRSLTRHVLVLD
jgi:tRNA (guanine10-N2)-dimethyltransferase